MSYHVVDSNYLRDTYALAPPDGSMYMDTEYMLKAIVESGIYISDVLITDIPRVNGLNVHLCSTKYNKDFNKDQTIKVTVVNTDENECDNSIYVYCVDTEDIGNMIKLFDDNKQRIKLEKCLISANVVVTHTNGDNITVHAQHVKYRNIPKIKLFDVDNVSYNSNLFLSTIKYKVHKPFVCWLKNGYKLKVPDMFDNNQYELISLEYFYHVWSDDSFRIPGNIWKYSEIHMFFTVGDVVLNQCIPFECLEVEFNHVYADMIYDSYIGCYIWKIDHNVVSSRYVKRDVQPDFDNVGIGPRNNDHKQCLYFIRLTGDYNEGNTYLNVEYNIEDETNNNVEIRCKNFGIHGVINVPYTLHIYGKLHQ